MASFSPVRPHETFHLHALVARVELNQDGLPRPDFDGLCDFGGACEEAIRAAGKANSRAAPARERHKRRRVFVVPHAPGEEKRRNTRREKYREWGAQREQPLARRPRARQRVVTRNRLQQFGASRFEPFKEPFNGRKKRRQIAAQGALATSNRPNNLKYERSTARKQA